MDQNKEYRDLVRKNHVTREQLEFLRVFQKGGGIFAIMEDPNETWSVKEIIRQLVPMTALGHEKVRIGGDADGGYIMLDPGQGGIAYSLGVSLHSPWDLEMAERGFTVFQYDASIDAQPDAHPHLFFHKYFVSGDKNEGLYKTLDRMIAENGHQDERDMILQMDIEDAEWEVLHHIERDTLLRFKQIIIEIHKVELSIYKYCILRKLRETHTPIHFHYNNNTSGCVYLPRPGFIYNGNVMEITYVRNDDFAFSECAEYFPTPLDRRNGNRYPLDIPIGYFDLLMRENW